MGTHFFAIGRRPDYGHRVSVRTHPVFQRLALAWLLSGSLVACTASEDANEASKATDVKSLFADTKAKLDATPTPDSSAACCTTRADCTGAERSVCLLPALGGAGFCLEIPPTSGDCADDSDCNLGQHCEGASVSCTCGQGACADPPKPGRCLGFSIMCCTADQDCHEGAVCVRPPAATGGVCVNRPDPGLCFVASHCAVDQQCVGAGSCACDGTCTGEPKPGKCTAPEPVVCCATSSDCPSTASCIGPEGKRRCVPTVAAGTCWGDANCAPGETCEGALVCPCELPCPTLTLGGCKAKPPAPCTSDSACPGGSCIPAGTCTPGCAVGDPSCCDQSKCVALTNACAKDADCPAGICVAGTTCAPGCVPPSAACCYGNTCQPAGKCSVSNPAGCAQLGCGTGFTCAPSATCHPSACTCDLGKGTWSCTKDCAGGECVKSACPGKSPAGCLKSGCAAGLECKTNLGCAPSSCTCDESTGTWQCLPDCGGGLCAKP